MKNSSFLSFIFVSLVATNASADGAFHWVDAEGRDHYGSNPPKNARSVESLSTKSFSRYSSQKLLGGFRQRQVTDETVRARLTPEKPGKTRSIAPTGIAIEEESLLPEPEVPQLIEGPVTLKQDKQNRITECSVVIKNTAAIPVNGVLINFEFSDGTFVPGSGPDSIDSDSSAKFSVPEAMLPFTLNGIQGAPPKPKVVIKAAGDPG